MIETNQFPSSTAVVGEDGPGRGPGREVGRQKSRGPHQFHVGQGDAAPAGQEVKGQPAAGRTQGQAPGRRQTGQGPGQDIE